ncbi:MAG: hypothetical protein V2I27_09725 [Erythrobacter sp.]|nr:hypothetical protein [Erythrobacter sp.]
MRRALALLGAALLSTAAAAEPTEVTVRVIAQDAKFIGESMGSAAIELRDAATGELLAEGRTMGTTGETALIMESHPRQTAMSDGQSAKFTATLDIAEPTLIELTAKGPLGRPHSMLTITQQRWLMPGEPLTAGDGWLVEMPGIAITPRVQMTVDGIEAGAFIELMCGCPITPGGRWNAEEYTVTASLWSGSDKLFERELAFVESPGGYAARIPLSAGGPAATRIVYHARNSRTGNSGLATLPLE